MYTIFADLKEGDRFRLNHETFLKCTHVDYMFNAIRTEPNDLGVEVISINENTQVEKIN